MYQIKPKTSFACGKQTFCPDCRPGNRAHVDALGRPEYHCPSSRPSVGWQRVYFSRSGVPACSCERGKYRACHGLPADCAAHAQLVVWAIRVGRFPAPDDLGQSLPRVISVTPFELFDEPALDVKARARRQGIGLVDLYECAA